MAQNKYGDKYGYAEKIVGVWGEPPAYSYSPWLGGIDDGGFFGLEKIVDETRGIVQGYSATFSYYYEGRFVAMCDDKPVALKKLKDIEIEEPMYGHYQFMNITIDGVVHDGVNHDRCQLQMLDRNKFEYRKIQSDGTFIRFKSQKLLIEGNNLILPNQTGLYRSNISYDEKENMYITVPELRIRNKKIEIQNSIDGKINLDNISFITRG